MIVLSLLLVLVTLLGHLALWTWLYNRLHASGFSTGVVLALEKLTMVLVTVSAALLTVEMSSRRPFVSGAPWDGVDRLLMAYALACWIMLGRVVFKWIGQRSSPRDQSALISNHTERLTMKDHAGDRLIGRRSTRLAGAIPLNQILDVHFQHKTIRVENLPESLHGLRIAQLSDLHFTGQLTPRFFETVVHRANAWQPDLVCLTGDLVDKAACIDWIPETLGRLVARCGCYFILGNHDQRLPDVSRLRRALTDVGLEDLGGSAVIRTIAETPVLLAGNECPWFPPAPNLPRQAHAPGSVPIFSILLSHSPDQLPWARREGFNLMLSGHTHGGQIRFPLVGPVVCPSRFGVQYASGLYWEPPTLMHVNRGLSGVHPLRFGCPPEVTLLELQNEDWRP